MATREPVRKWLEALTNISKALSYFLDVQVLSPKVIGIFLDLVPVVLIINTK